MEGKPVLESKASVKDKFVLDDRSSVESKPVLEVNGRGLEVLRLLGKGKGGYSYLVKDPLAMGSNVTDSNGDGCYVVKQIHHEPCSYYSFGNKLEAELGDYAKLAELGLPMPKLLDVDFGNERILKQYIPGETILDHIVSGTMEESFLDQVRAMCSLVYCAGLNIDYFPTNFIVDDGSLDPSNMGRLFYIDYECNGYMEKWDFEHWGIQYWSMTKALEEHLSSMQHPNNAQNESPDGENIGRG